MSASTEEERNEFLRGCVPGDELELDCWDNRTRKVTVTARIELQNGGVCLKAEGYGTKYQIDVPRPLMEGASVRIRWPSDWSGVRRARSEKEGQQIWSNVTAADLGIPDQ